MLLHACTPTRNPQEDFDAAAERIKNVPGPDNDEMLELYGLFKQATVGDNETGVCALPGASSSSSSSALSSSALSSGSAPAAALAGAPSAPLSARQPILHAPC